MAKRTLRKTAASGLDRHELLKIDPIRFKPDLSPADLKNALTPIKIANLSVIHFPVIETISPTKTVGLGRTNLTLVRPEILQTDATPAFAKFDPAHGTPQQRPTVSVHFEPKMYGLTGNVTFIMSFSIETFGAANVNVGAFAGSGTSTGVGARTINGQVFVSITFHNVPATQQVFGHVSAMGGAAWRWFQTRISYLPIIVTA